MEGEKMEQARDALQFVLDHLSQGDRFNIIAFSTGVRAFSAQPEPLSALPEARRFVDELRPEGSTDINRALLEAIAGADRERPTIVIFLTDGLPTSGVVETPQILANVEQAASSNLRIFPFGVGDDVDTVLLDTLAQEQRGTSAYVRPSERVEEQVGSFYAKVSTPVLADLPLDVSGVQLEDTYPFPLPDLFAGTQLILTGRYREGGPASLTLTGQVNGQEHSFRFDDLTFATERATSSQSGEFIPRLWATRKVGYLLNQIRLRGENRETIDEIVNLSVRYGIITPYTSFLVEEPELALSQEGRGQLADEEFAAAQAAPAAEVSGESAVSKAVEQNELAEADMAAPLPATAAPGADGTGGVAGATAAVTTVGDKAFVLKEGVWTDTTFDPSVMTTTELPFPSDLFLEFLGDHSAAGKYFALGQRVVVVLDGVAYETVEGDPAELSQPDEAEANSAQPAPVPELTEGQVQPDESSLPASSSHLTLTADVTEGVAPLEVNFSGSLVAGPEDDQNYACLPSQFEFGDGNSLTIMSECGGEPNERRDTANYVYDQAGEYQVTFTLGEIKSEPVTIIVKDEAEASNPIEEPEPPAVQAAPATPEPVNTSEITTAESNSSIYNVWGLLLLPLLGLAIGWFMWGRGRK
jgi:Ca-activated chloride channel family protein